MAIFEYLCKHCELILEVEAPPGKAKSKKKCPECGKFATRYYGNASVQVSFGSDVDFHTVRSRARRNRIKTDPQDGRRFYETAIEHSKERLGDGSTCYSKVVPNMKVLEKTRGLRKLTKKEQTEGERKAKKLISQGIRKVYKKK